MLRQLERVCLQELYRNAGRLKADLGERLEQSAGNYLRALNRHVEQARESVRAALERAAAMQRPSVEDRARTQADQAARRALLGELDRELAALLVGWDVA